MLSVTMWANLRCMRAIILSWKKKSWNPDIASCLYRRQVALSRNRSRRRFARAYVRRVFPYHRHSRWILGGYLVGTWWFLLAVALHRAISLLAIRQIVDRARASKRHIRPPYFDLSPFFFSIYLLVLPPSVSTLFSPSIR